MRPIVIIESPYAGDVARNVAYARAAMRDCIDRGETPFASHLMYPGILDDLNADERKLGIEMGYQLWPAASLIVFYVDLGWSRGMEAARERVGRMLAKSWEERSIPAWAERVREKAARRA